MRNRIKNSDKLPLKRIVSNYIYLLRYAFKKDACCIVLIFSAFTLGGVGYACMDTIFIRSFISFLSDSRYDLRDTVILAAGATIGMAVFMAFEKCVQSLAKPRLIRLSGNVQEEMIRKAVKMDLMCYDCRIYYDDFVVAAAQLEEVVSTAIIDLAQMGRNVITLLVLSELITAIDPVIAVFPILGFIVNVISRFRIMKLEYDFDVKKKTIMRRANYSKRVFYQPEYAKEIKLSHIEIPLEKQFNEAVDETITLAKKYGIPIALWSLVNWITVFTLLSMFCTPLYLGYMALAARKAALKDVAALNNAQGSVRNQLDAINYCIGKIQHAGLFCERFRRFMNYESRVEAGQRIALVGENGAGKSTLIKLLMRLYDVTEGEICYGGEDIRHYSTDAYRSLFGSIFQDYQLYAATVLENVMMNESSEKEADRACAALEKSGFQSRLKTLPAGLSTVLTREFDEKGVQLSGGEAQKVAIARLFAKKERLRIAVLDEPSSALDPQAEYELNKNIMDRAGDAAVIFISHRLSTTKNADRIYMFENGEIIEQGTHQELMKLNGQYAKMFRCQAKYYQENVDRLSSSLASSS